MGDSLSRRDFLRLAGVGAAAMAIPGSLMAAVEGQGRKPNVLVILADDLGYGELGIQGNKQIPTPNIDSIAKNGVRFTNGYVSCPVCSPTRAGLMTGRYQQRFGHELNPGPPELADKNFGLPLGEKTIANYMKEQGYATGIVGKWHLGYEPQYHPQKRGFDEFFGFLGGAHAYNTGGEEGVNAIRRGSTPVEEKEYLTDAFGREAVAFIERHKNEPFFLYLPFNAVHGPLQESPKDKDLFPEITDSKRRIYAKMTKSMDDAVGAVLTKLRDLGLEENTLVVYHSDNGGPTKSTSSGNGPLNGFKGDTLEGGIRVPYMMQWKGKLPAGKVYDKPVIALDVLPTVVAVAGGKAASNVEGVDLLPFITGDKNGSPHDKLFWRYGKKWAVRAGDWKLVNNDGDTMLFNLANDIGEKNDLASENPDKFAQLDAAYKAWDAKNIPPAWSGRADVLKRAAAPKKKKKKKVQ